MAEIKPKGKSAASIVVNSIKGMDAKTPIPLQYGQDTFKYSPLGKPYVPFLDQKDNLAILFLEARLGSTTQDACISTIVESVIGTGLKIVDNENPDKDFTDWLKNVNNRRESMDDVIKECADGERSMGNHFIEIVKGQLGNAKYIKVYGHSIRYARLGKLSETTGQPTTVIISRSFGKGVRNNTKLPDDNIEIPLYDPDAVDDSTNWKQDGKGQYRTIIHLKNKKTGIDFYGLPASASSLRQQVQEGKLSQYNIDNLDNNMVIGGLLVLQSSMTQEEANVQGRQIINTHTGEGKAGRVAVISSESGIKDFDYKTFDTHKEGSYIELDKRIEEKIIGSNNWVREFCYSDAGALGRGGAYLRTLWDLKEISLLNPLRKKIIDHVVMPIAKIYADWHGKKEVATYQFSLKAPMPFSFFGDLKPEDFMMVNEARVLAGHPEDENMKGKYIAELKSKTKDVPTQPPTS